MYKISENFKTKAEFQEIKNKRKCWSECKFCLKNWDEIETENIHMIVDQEKFVNGNNTFFICDNCKKDGNFKSS